ncbi:L-2-hydroxyglutarate oxidase [Urechidicola vernalis]|uniref:L-2-hydroxyglutarate oxidase n=1 Tax=Urechidicola vernalis TaxID=3075600 RepID=A0ABU2Y319_9FLAO|nr:L-2-hydroxyglutarate oxidase [Urechidicola sp. P050]MDT0551635.1 L-2-hydroxyglutarate oxidase [Urechidicola sp. P050]
MSNKFDFIVVGAGIIGLATAYKLQCKFPSKTIVILEKEPEIGLHQTGRNSGVIHSGIYYTPDSFKAKNCKNGREQLVSFAEKFDVDYKTCGKIIVATSEAEEGLLDIIFAKGIQNGTPGIHYLTCDQIKEKEPYIRGVKGIWVPTAGIIDYVGLCKKFMEQIASINSQSKIVTNCKVESILDGEIVTSLGSFNSDKTICCAGLQADRIAKKNKVDPKLQIVGFRGDYYEMTEASKFKIRNLVYPVPDPNFPFLGVHFTPMIDGRVECGPNAVFSFKREGYTTTSFNLKDSWQALTYRGTWKLFFRHWRKGIEEYKRAFSKKMFVKELQGMMPSITMDDVKPARAGVRAQALDSKGGLVDDFKIVERGNVIHVLNAPSPAATSCLAIADQIIQKI